MGYNPGVQREKQISPALQKYIEISKWEGELPKIFKTIDDEFDNLRSRIDKAKAIDENSKLGKTERIGTNSASIILVGVLGIVLDLCETGKLMYHDPRLQRTNTKNVVEDYLHGYHDVATKLLMVVGKVIVDEDVVVAVTDQVESLHDLAHIRGIAMQREAIENMREKSQK